jgi:hypothetical protein
MPSVTHRSPAGQSRAESLQAVWHLLKAHMSGELQSLFIEQVAANPDGPELLQLAVTTVTSTAAPAAQPAMPVERLRPDKYLIR